MNHEVSLNITTVETMLHSQFTFFRTTDPQTVCQQLFEAQNHKRPVTVIAVCCPWMDDVRSLIPYASESEGTDVCVPGPNSKRITSAVKRINSTVETLDTMGISSQVALLVSNVQPQAHRLVIDQALTNLPERLHDYLNTLLPKMQMNSTFIEIEKNTLTHATHIKNQIPDISMDIYNHLELLSHIFSQGKKPGVKNTFDTLFRWMSELDLVWDSSLNTETFLEALYLFDMSYLPEIINRNNPFIWINMQPDNSRHTQIIENVLQTFGSYPIIKGFQYERSLYE